MDIFLKFRHRVTGEDASMHDIDEALCKHFGAIVSPTEWYKNWLNNIAVLFAVGLRGEEVTRQVRSGVWDPEMAYALVEVAEFIEEHYEPVSGVIPERMSLN